MDRLFLAIAIVYLSVAFYILLVVGLAIIVQIKETIEKYLKEKRGVTRK